MAETKTTTTRNQNQTPLYLVCIALLVAVVLAIVGFAGKNNAVQQNAELTAQLEELTAVIDPYGDGSCYVILRTNLDLSVAADAHFQQVQRDRLANASVVSNAKLYSSLDVGAFYDRMTELRAEMQAAMAEAGGHTADDGHDHSADAGTDTAGEATADTGADAEPAA